MPRMVTMLAAMTLLVLAVTTEGRVPREPEEILEHGRHLARMLESGEAHQDPSAWREHAAELRGMLRWASSVPGGQMSIEQNPGGQRLIDQIRGWSADDEPLPEAESVRQWVAGLQEIFRLGRRLSSPGLGQQELKRARQILELELRQAVYSEARQPGAGLNQRLADLIAQYVMDPLFGGRTRTARHALLAVCFILLALLLGHVIWELTRAGGWATAEGEPSTIQTGQTLLEAARSPRQLLDRGDAAREDGRFLQAMGLYYLALITLLARTGCTRLDRTLTNREHYRFSSSSGLLPEELLERLARLNEFFDRRCYGSHEASREDATYLRREVGEFIDAL